LNTVPSSARSCQPTPRHHLFLFPRPPPPRRLHSFPTRRSSDLSPPERRNGATGSTSPHKRTDHNAGHGRRRGPVPRRVRKNVRRDRKSTRLNSSHSQISYAVFCLKKKKHKVRYRHAVSHHDHAP